jgi:tetratricopeptide (TPR) repeat protein
MLVGAAITWRRRESVEVALALWSLGLVASMVLFFVNARYRAPLVFFGSIPAAQGLAAIVGAWRARDRRRVVKGLGACAVLAALMAAVAVPQRGYPLPMEWDQASVLASAGSHDAARQWLDRALARAEDDPALRLAAAAFYAESEEREREREQLERMLATPDPEPDLVHLGHEALAHSYLSERRFDAALIEVEKARAVRIDFAEWHGYPHFQLGLGPLADCWLRLLAAEIDARTGNLARARERIGSVRSDCGEHGRFGPRLLDVEVLCARVGPNTTTTP